MVDPDGDEGRVLNRFIRLDGARRESILAPGVKLWRRVRDVTYAEYLARYPSNPSVDVGDARASDHVVRASTNSGPDSGKRDRRTDVMRDERESSSTRRHTIRVFQYELSLPSPG